MKPPRMKRSHGGNTTFQSPSGASSFPNTDWVCMRSVFLRDSRAALMSKGKLFLRASHVRELTHTQQLFGSDDF
jgi:hypothetical protein